MSEFSESYHLQSDNAQDAVDLLQRAGEKGHVYPPGAGWVTFVSEGNLFEPNPAIVNANKGTLVHYVNQADYLCWFAIFENSKMTCAYRCEWEEGLHADASEYSRNALSRILDPAKSGELDAFEKALEPSRIDKIFEENPARKFAEFIGLEHFDYVSYDEVTEALQQDSKEVAGVIEVK